MPKIDLGKIFTPHNRGILLDVVVFVFQLILMTILSRLFANLIHHANEDIIAQASIGLWSLAIVFLQPVGAILKRRRAHQRHPALDVPAPYFLFHPIFYFISKLLFLIVASTKIAELVYGEIRTSLFILLFIGVPVLAIANTAIAYLFYFREPKHAPVFKFLQSPLSETLGDVCLFLNVLGYQLYWGFLMLELTKDYSSILGRLFMFGFTALFIYFPPRLFYLAEDGERPLTWLMMLLANTPFILRIFFA
jgi:hypothetical protein